MLRIFFLVAGVALAAASPCRGELVAYWDFNSFDPATDTLLMADTGEGSINLTPWGGDVDNFAGSAINAPPGSVAGKSLSLKGQDGNNSYIQIKTSLSGLESPVITFATRGTGTGYDTGNWSWSTDGSSFTDLAGVNTATRSTSYSLATVDFSSVSGLTDASDAFFRYTLDGATSTSGNNRIDNLQINATMTAVPEPGSTALLSMIGGAGAIGHRMRRRSAPK